MIKILEKNTDLIYIYEVHAYVENLASLLIYHYKLETFAYSCRCRDVKNPIININICLR